MKVKRVVFALLLVVTAASAVFAADDGPLFTRNISRTPDTMTGGAQLSVMDMYIAAQNTQGELIEIEYLVGDKDNSTVLYTRAEAKPLIATYNDGIEVDEEDTGGDLGMMTGAGFGERDAFVAVSLDDGATWKNTNLSDSAARSSFVLKNGHDYPGDVFKIMHSVVDNRVLVAWISRFCESGSPLYAWEDVAKEELLALYPELDNPVDVDGEAEPYQMYTDDLFGVAGNQKSVDYTLQGFPEVGEVPYGCVWVARGTLEQVDENLYGIVWRQAERLTSGRRDANRIEVTGTSGAGFIISWQEDPEGLRPGKGLGPGEGWSGAIANSKTDIWYTYIDWDHFDDVCLEEDRWGSCTTIGPASAYVEDEKPKSVVPFANPVRLTDNNSCRAGVAVDNSGYQPYCYADFDDNGTPDLCAESVSWTNPGGTTLNLCIAEDGRVLTGRTASTRVRWALKPYTNTEGETSAWVLLGEEKMKALGSEVDPETEEPIDIGKNMWYHTFDMFNPELVQQGLMLNSPAIDYETGAEFPVQVDDWGNEYYETEIARRVNLMVQGNSATLASESKTSAILIYKEGILFQGGPADIFIRRVVLPDTFDPAVDNPFAYENVQCVEFADDGTATDVALLYDDGSNPNYVRGLCPAQGMNVSGTTILGCDGVAGDCADAFPWDADAQEGAYPKVTEWVQAPDNFNDPSWVNPYDVSKGHRGFIDGDFVMMMYATAPNWKANTVGNESYNLYIRRSFDGGQTWTTLPASYTHIDGETYSGDGTESCEWYGWGGTSEYEVCTTYGAGEFEQARNVSQLTGTRITVLDPRYSPSGGMLKKDYTALLCYDEAAADGAGDWVSCGDTEAPYPEETRDPSVYFVTYETGDNTVVTEETGTVPMDMYYSRAFNFGDDWDTVEFTTSSGQLVDRWDWLENGPDLATEASVYGNPIGDRFYAVWNQELEIALDVFTDMDVEFRRILFNLTDTESYPTLAILSDVPAEVPYSPDTELTFVGTGRDTDRMGEGQQGQGIDAYEWSSDIDGVLSTEQSFTIAATDLTMGLHTFTFSVQDNEGNTSSTSVIVGVGVANTSLHKVFLPVCLR
jgi:hypothetical protein